MTQQTAIEILQDIQYEGFVKALYNRTGDMSKDFSHAVLGIVTECHEYLTATDAVNAIEEAGDMCFYLTALKQVLDEMSPTDYEDYNKLNDAAFERMNQEDFNVVSTYVEWLDLAKRWVGYGKPPTMSTTELLAEASALVSFVINCGVYGEPDMKTVIVTNVEKLLKRYNGMKFNAERAVTRDLFAEREVLEANAA